MGKTGRSGALGGERLMGTAAYRGKGLKERGSARGQWPPASDSSPPMHHTNLSSHKPGDSGGPH